MKQALTLAVSGLCAIVWNGSYAQESTENKLKRALLDSLVRYELLKPTYSELKTSFQDVQIKNVSLSGQLQEAKLQEQTARAQLQQAVTGQQQKWWKGFYWGWAVGAVTTTIIFLKK